MALASVLPSYIDAELRVAEAIDPDVKPAHHEALIKGVDGTLVVAKLRNVPYVILFRWEGYLYVCGCVQCEGVLAFETSKSKKKYHKIFFQRFFFTIVFLIRSVR